MKILSDINAKNKTKRILFFQISHFYCSFLCDINIQRLIGWDVFRRFLGIDWESGMVHSKLAQEFWSANVLSLLLWFFVAWRGEGEWQTKREGGEGGANKWQPSALWGPLGANVLHELGTEFVFFWWWFDEASLCFCFWEWRLWFNDTCIFAFADLRCIILHWLK